MLLGSRIGRSLATVAAQERPEILLGALGWSLSGNRRFSDVERWPESVSGFEDIAPLVRLVSFDPQGKLGTSSYDDELSSALARYGIRNVELRLEDSHTADLPEGEYSLVLVDGDPSYDGTERDFDRFCRRLRPGGHALFHDAAPGGARSRQLAPLVEEIGRDPDFDRQPDVGTFVHFIRTIGA